MANFGESGMRAEPEAERHVIGALLLSGMNGDADCATTVLGTLTAGDFADRARRTLFAAAERLVARGEPMEDALWLGELDGALPRDDAAAELLACGESVATTATVASYIARVRDASRQRRAVCAINDALIGLRTCEGDGREVVTVLDAALADVYRGTKRGAVLVRAADVEPQPVKWLWPNRIALGKVTLLAGDPGLGKSLATLAIASAVSRGAPWPDAPHDPQLAGGVVLLSAEDDFADTIRPRLDAHEADCERIFSLTSLADLALDIGQLHEAIDDTDQCRLVVVDPISAYMGRADSHVNAEVRAVLTPLGHLAAEKRVAIMAVTHLRKGEGAAMYRAMGSLAFVAAARAAWAIVRDKQDARRRLMLAVKNNLAADVANGLAFTVEPHGPSGAPVVCWEREPVTITADEAMAPELKRRGPPSDEHDQAVEFLRERLVDEARSAREVIDEAVNGCGIAKRTLDRARRTIGVVAFRREHRGPWWWRLSDSSDCYNGEVEPLAQETWQSGNLSHSPMNFDGVDGADGQVAK